MQFIARKKEPDYGTTQPIRKFALLPHHIMGTNTIVWLERYLQLWAFIDTNYQLPIDNNKAEQFKVGKWIKLSESTI